MQSTATDRRQPLSALLSQILVAFTLEFDNEFERRMGVAGFRGIGLSLNVWSNLLRFLNQDGMPVGALMDAAFGGPERVVATLGCLERWLYIRLDPPSADHALPHHPHRRTGRMVRDGYGSGRRIRRDWIVQPTDKGRGALAIWPPLFDVIEGRWRSRFGDADISALRTALHSSVGGLDLELPDAVPPDTPAGLGSFPPRRTPEAADAPLVMLLSKALLGFAVEFNRESAMPLPLAANVLRVVTREGVPFRDLPALTGGSPEVSAIGWKLKRCVETASVKGRKLVRLTPLGARVHDAYPRLVRGIEREWEERFGEQTVYDLRAALRALFRRSPDGRSLIAEGLVPPAGTRRSGDVATALSVMRFVPAEQKRTKEMAAQTAAFIDDPAANLPHYPLWDMNRGFGP